MSVVESLVSINPAGQHVDGEIISIFVSYEASQVSEFEATESDDSIQKVLNGKC